MNKLKIIVNTISKGMKFKREKIRISFLSFFDKKSTFDPYVFIDRFVVLHNVKIGSYSYVGYNSKINNCEIGKFCSISSDVKIGLGKHPINRVTTSPIIYSNHNPFKLEISADTHFYNESEKVVIGNDVWLGTNVIVMDGVTIGTGAIIAAGSIVTKNVAPYEIVGGIPAKLIKKRFNDDIIINLIKSQWWDWNLDKIKENIHALNDINKFINLIEKMEEEQNENSNFSK